VSGLQLASGLVVYAIGCTLQGVLGFGAGLFAVPILALIHPDFVPGPVLMMNPLLSGFMGTTVAVGGPPIALAFHDLPGPVMRATLSIYFLVGTTISLVVLALAGQFGTSDMLLAAWLVLPAMVGVALSGPLRAPLDRGWLAPAVYVLSSVAAVVLLVRSLA
jgi:hypothetical protein